MPSTPLCPPGGELQREDIRFYRAEVDAKKERLNAIMEDVAALQSR